ncbi:MAG: hypothetical protein ACM4D3_05790, partial [Candidatus Sericytochromatia bacterium]
MVFTLAAMRFSRASMVSWQRDLVELSRSEFGLQSGLDLKPFAQRVAALGVAQPGVTDEVVGVDLMDAVEQPVGQLDAPPDQIVAPVHQEFHLPGHLVV